MVDFLAGDPTTFVWGTGEFQGPGGGREAAKYYAWTRFFNIFKRNPTQVELDRVLPAYLGGDQNIAEVAGGNAAVAALYQEESLYGYAASGDPRKLDTAPSMTSTPPPANGVSTSSPVPGDGASSLPMGASMNAYGPAYYAPAGGVPAPASLSLYQTRAEDAATAPIIQTGAPGGMDKSILIFAALAVGGFFLLRKGI